MRTPFDGAASPSSDPATRFTLLCLRGRWDPRALEDARELAQMGDLDWDAWCDAVQAECLAPLLYRILRGQLLAPAPVEQVLRQAYDDTALRNTFLFLRLEEALVGLAGRGIPVILLNGAALSKTVYARAPVRQVSDLDLLVRHEDARSALATLTALGYTQVGLREKRVGAAIEFEIEVGLHKPGPVDTLIEIHWGLLDSPHYQHKLPMTWFWETAQPLCVGDAEALMLGTEAQVLHLCAHLVLGHGGQGLRWLHDVAEVLHYYEGRLDWDVLLAKAQECDLVLPLKQALSQVVDGWAAPAPPHVLTRLNELQPSPEERRVFDWLTSFDWGAEGGQTVARHFWADLVTLPGWRRRLEYAFTGLLPSPAYMRQRYGIRHSYLLPLYYLYRYALGIRSLVQRQR